MPRFLLKRAIALWLILSATLLALLISESPTLAYTPFASIEIQHGKGRIVHLPNRIFDCTQGANRWQCNALISEQPLEMTWSYQPQYPNELGECRATYAGKVISCEASGADFVRGLQDRYKLWDDLGMSASQLTGLRWQYWGINLLMSLRELGLIGLSLSLSVIGGVLVAVGAWRSPGRLAKGIASLACGVGMALLVSNYFGQILLETLYGAGISDEQWGWLTGGLAIATGIGTWISTAALLYFPFSRVMRLLVSLLAGLSLFSLLAQSVGISYLLSFLGLPIANNLAWSRLPIFIASGAAWLAAFWLYRKRPINTRRFVSFTSGLGVFSIGSLMGLFCLLWLGYAD
ncbi:hypothetical protein P7L53_05170 [Thermoleptolyngbya sichuanensis XZ-Cy5]|uniref:hypothetical protein n=1 Tax=Thermoleptolyngbya sichuanensis TaxID=2885951 RepID=UPI00240D6898|nr:hypothetical protein [Thermoleptolyngbya sichuanensis]MDG2615630.1 hypothetical protein [Thermoleptolyngbya sichuanensis XZ-Cy5]